MVTQNSAKRILAIDYGLARLGMALSDERCVIALPHKTMKAARSVAGTVVLVVAEMRELSLEKVIIGLPLMMNGSVGLIADEVHHFAELLRAAVAVPILLWDERLTTAQAERSLREGSLSRKKRTARVDGVAAILILQSYLDYTTF